jgi:hypothetical protein
MWPLGLLFFIPPATNKYADNEMKLGMDGFVVIDQYFPELSPLDLEFS